MEEEEEEEVGGWVEERGGGWGWEVDRRVIASSRVQQNINVIDSLQMAI